MNIENIFKIAKAHDVSIEFRSSTNDDLYSIRIIKEKYALAKVIHSHEINVFDEILCDMLRRLDSEITNSDKKASKQENKKVEPIDHGRVQCPVCKNHQLVKYQNYCGECGQHLDWEVAK